ncbi:hypothetical protein LINGRAHAP2_LOCUS19426 [Linum grandiflorum]
MNLHVICQSMPIIWESGRGAAVDELEGRLYLFHFEHQLDVHMVMDKGP